MCLSQVEGRVYCVATRWSKPNWVCLQYSVGSCWGQGPRPSCVKLPSQAPHRWCRLDSRTSLSLSPLGWIALSELPEYCFVSLLRLLCWENLPQDQARALCSHHRLGGNQPEVQEIQHLFYLSGCPAGCTSGCGLQALCFCSGWLQMALIEPWSAEWVRWQSEKVSMVHSSYLST